MTEAKVIVNSISRDNKTAYTHAKMNGGAFTMRGNSIISTGIDGSKSVVKNVGQARVRLKNELRVVVLK